MNRLFLSIVLIVFCFTTTVQAEPLACLDKTPCQQGQGPPMCCDKPPCEFGEQIRLKQAMRNLFSNPKVRKTFQKKAGGDNPEAALKLYEYVLKKSTEMGNTIKCKWDFNKFPPTFEVNTDCDIVAKMPKGDKMMSKEEALNKIETCTEFIEAIYLHEGLHKDDCDPVAKAKQGIEAYAREEREGYTREINYLKAERLNWWRACSDHYKNKGPKKKSAKAGIDALKKNMKKNGTAKKPKAGK